jgi:predicted PurR-regulated permease PerM
MMAVRDRVRAGWPAPIYITTRLRAVLVAVLVAALVLVCWRAPVAPVVFLLGLLLALILSFPLRPLCRVMPRGQAVAVAVGGAVLLLVLVAANVAPLLFEELPGYVATLSEYQARVVSNPPAAAVLTAVAYLTINLTDGNVLTPRLQGGALRLHPLVVMLAVLAASQLFGLLGVLFTLPLLAVLRVVGGFFAARLRTRPVPAPELKTPLPATVAAPLRTA